MRNRPLLSRPRCPRRRPNAAPTRSQLGGSRKHRRIALPQSADVEIGTEFLANFAGHISVMVKSRVQTIIFRCIDFVLRVLSFQPWRQGLLRGDGRRRDLGRPAGVAAATGSRGKVGRGCRSAAALAAAATPARQQRGGAPTRLNHSRVRARSLASVRVSTLPTPLGHSTTSRIPPTSHPNTAYRLRAYAPASIDPLLSHRTFCRRRRHRNGRWPQRHTNSTPARAQPQALLRMKRRIPFSVCFLSPWGCPSEMKTAAPVPAPVCAAAHPLWRCHTRRARLQARVRFGLGRTPHLPDLFRPLQLHPRAWGGRQRRRNTAMRRTTANRRGRTTFY